MSRGRSTLLLLLVALALGAYVYFVESEREPAAERAERRDRVFEGLDAEQLEEIRVRPSAGEATTLRKENGRWRIVAPVEAEADEAEASALASSLASLDVQRVVDDAPGALDQFGLDAPRIEVAFRQAGEAEPRTLLLGSRTPTGGDMYAKLAASPRVFLVNAYLDSTFDRKTFDLRDKSVLKVERGAVDAVELVVPGTTMRFAKSGNTWRMTAPVEARADFGAIEGLISRLNSAQMRSIVATEPERLDRFGLEPPRYQATLRAGNTTTVLQVGAEGDGGVYARDASRPLVFTVEPYLTQELGKAPVDFRVKDLFAFRSFNGRRFELTRDGRTTVFEKQKAEGDAPEERWRQIEPAQEADESTIVTFLSRVTNLRAEDFVERLPAGAQIVASAVAHPQDGVEERVIFHRAGEAVYAVRADEPGAARLDTTTFDDAMRALDEVK
jgi:hypothetical protein